MYAGAKADGRFRSREQKIGKPAERAFLRIVHTVAVVECKVEARGLGIRMNLLKQPCADIKFLGAPGGSGRVLAQTKFGNGFLRGVEFALLLVVIEDACCRVEISGICLLRRLGFIQELSQTVRLRKQVEVALDQLRRPQWLKTLLIDSKSLLKRSLPVFDKRSCLYGKNIVGRKFFMILRDKLCRGGKILYGDQGLEKKRGEGRVFGVMRQPNAGQRPPNFCFAALHPVPRQKHVTTT